MIYCGHEYTQANAQASRSPSKPDNQAARRPRAAKSTTLRADGKPTVPTTIAVELETNPFLRPSEPGVQTHLGMEGAAAADVFAEIRRRKDSF